MPVFLTGIFLLESGGVLPVLVFLIHGKPRSIRKSRDTGACNARPAVFLFAVHCETIACKNVPS